MECTQVNLSRSGLKIMTLRPQNSAPGRADTLFFYNLDYSFWKMIPCPRIGGLIGQFLFYHDVGAASGVFYPSEGLFNLDSFLEVAVLYNDSTGFTATSVNKIFIINENGTLTDSILNVFQSGSSSFQVHADTSANYKAYVGARTGVDIYNLPGTLPCETCVTRSLGTAKLDDPQKSIISQPIPNPSKDNVKIAFTLPEGVNMAELQVFDMKGQRIRSYKVDNKFGFIMLDNSQLAAGTYLYNIVVDGSISSTQKFVVIR